MPRQVILHVGMHKTGTTAIQAALAGYDDGMTRMARLGTPNHSIPMLTIFSPDPARYHVWRRQGLGVQEVLARRDVFRQHLTAELALGRPRLILSGEEMSVMAPGMAQQMLGALRPFCDGIEVQGWLRPAAGYVASAFQQMVKAGQATTALPQPCYRRRFEPYLAALGPGAVHLHRYDPARRDGVAGFCRAVGLPAAAAAERAENTSLSADALRLVWALNRCGSQTMGSRAHLIARSRFVRHVAERNPGPLDLPPAIAAAALDPADLDWAETATGFRLRADDAPAADPRALQDWLSCLSPQASDRLEEDLQIIRRSPPGTPGGRVATLYQALLDEAQVQTALEPVFRAGTGRSPRPAADMPQDGHGAAKALP